MNRRIPLILLVALGLMAAPAIVAAAQPLLTATVVPGHEIDVTGTGFPGNADVLLAIERNGAAAGSQTLRTDAAGSFTATIDAGPGRGGAYTLVATSGSARAVADVVAVETAGAGGTGGIQPTPPPTDAASSVPLGPAPASGWARGLVAVLVSLFLTAGWLRQRDGVKAGQHVHRKRV
jgi:hypothetical protein